MDIQPCTPSPSEPPDLTDMATQPNAPRHEKSVSSPGFLKMPMEMVERIVRYLPFKSLLKLRLVNRQLHDMSFDTFKKKFPKQLSIKMNLEDLQRLVEIASHPLLSQKVNEVQIRSTYEDSLLAVFDKLAPKWENTTKDDRYELTGVPMHWTSFRKRLVDHTEDERHFRDSGVASSLLTRAMKLLTNLESVTQVHAPNHEQEWGWMELWLGKRLPPCDREGELKRKFKRQISRDDLKAIRDFRHNIDELEIYKFPADHYTSNSRDLDIIISAMAASDFTPTELDLTNMTFLVKEKTPIPDDLQTKFLQSSLRKLRSLKISPIFRQSSDANYVPWFLDAVSDTLEDLTITLLPGLLPPRESAGGISLAFDEIYRRCRFQNLKRLDSIFTPNAVPHLEQFILNHRSTLTRIFLRTTEGWGRIPESNTARYSEVLRACLEVSNLGTLAFLHNSEIHESRDGKRFIEAIDLTMSPNNPGRARLETSLRRWERREGAAGL